MGSEKLTAAQIAEELEGDLGAPWIECWSCGGEGFHDDCFEDCCSCTNPPCVTQRCDVCEGAGGFSESPAPAGRSALSTTTKGEGHE